MSPKILSCHLKFCHVSCDSVMSLMILCCHLWSFHVNDDPVISPMILLMSLLMILLCGLEWHRVLSNGSSDLCLIAPDSYLVIRDSCLVIPDSCLVVPDSCLIAIDPVVSVLSRYFCIFLIFHPYCGWLYFLYVNILLWRINFPSIDTVFPEQCHCMQTQLTSFPRHCVHGIELYKPRTFLAQTWHRP